MNATQLDDESTNSKHDAIWKSGQEVSQSVRGRGVDDRAASTNHNC